MDWIYILIAFVFEISLAVGLKYSESFTRFKVTIFTIITMILSYIFLSLGTKNIPNGTVYSVWTGIVAVTAIYEIHFFGEYRDLLRTVYIFKKL